MKKKLTVGGEALCPRFTSAAGTQAPAFGTTAIFFPLLCKMFRDKLQHDGR
jgi:hypothetical protein